MFNLLVGKTSVNKLISKCFYVRILIDHAANKNRTAKPSNLA